MAFLALHELSGSRRVLQIPAIGRFDTLAQTDLRAPAHVREARDVHQLARRAVGARRVGLDPAREARDLGHQLRELEDRDVLAGADVDAAEHGVGVDILISPGCVEREKRGRGYVIEAARKLSGA